MHAVFLFQDNDLSESDESREIVQNLVDEYKACESADYIKWGMDVRNTSPSLFLPLVELQVRSRVHYLIMCVGSRKAGIW
jgi:dihydrodipicolinate synthase/N-acetylneuraminate lyase